MVNRGPIPPGRQYARALAHAFHRCDVLERRLGTADEIISFCREQIAHFKAPKLVFFGPLPKTSTGKIQKFTLRDRAKEV